MLSCETFLPCSVTVSARLELARDLKFVFGRTHLFDGTGGPVMCATNEVQPQLGPRNASIQKSRLKRVRTGACQTSSGDRSGANATRSADVNHVKMPPL